MTAARLNDLVDHFYADGWLFTNSHEMYAVDNDEHLHWELEHRTGVRAELIFYVVGDLGERTDQLKDIRWCQQQGDEFKLYFVKRTSPEWSAGVSRLVEAIRPE